MKFNHQDLLNILTTCDIDNEIRTQAFLYCYEYVVDTYPLSQTQKDENLENIVVEHLTEYVYKELLLRCDITVINYVCDKLAQ